ncbi:MAG: hypothetical protein CM15mV101_330 [uncultured marine virus]|nr:MAG: hypothetical protein CM15mV101_330 [uncultured marine virus]
MALLDKITQIFQKLEPPKVRYNELASSESKLFTITESYPTTQIL